MKQDDTPPHPLLPFYKYSTSKLSQTFSSGFNRICKDYEENKMQYILTSARDQRGREWKLCKAFWTVQSWNGVIWTWWGGGRGARGARKWPCFVLSKPFHFHLGHNCNQKSELSFIWIWKRPAAKKHDLKLSFTFPCKPLSRKDRQTHVICSVFAPAIWFWVILVNRKI